MAAFKRPSSSIVVGNGNSLTCVIVLISLKIYICVCVYLYAIYYKISYAILIYNFAISQNPISSLCFCLFLERVS